MGVPARAAVEAPEGGRASDNGAQPRGRWVAQTAYTCLRCAAHGWHAPFGASPPSWAATVFGMAWWCASLGHETCRENGFVYPPPRVSAGAGDRRRVVEGWLAPSERPLAATGALLRATPRMRGRKE